MHAERLTQWHPNVIASAVKQHLANDELHPFGAPLSQLAISGPYMNHSTLSLVQ